ncbi:DUF4388 domain-containing protein [Leptolyngbya sp. FACHB-261]|uniref:DUF4388 domain-containing protein n=1 Tax=Leptolyngbya sp. FACHB-261 TaxID=2692806 RepID=UPI001688F141|nr:DUF4388 domain-containing protein [Leptolyngbya sp. FACHB-261]MBD2102988.1 DUF4388 domain-containing protein [Leptolyngbya sp. FACHB-261]
MALSGSLADFSLPELLQLVDQGHKTGLLTIQPMLDSLLDFRASTQLQVHKIWLYQGRIVAVEVASEVPPLTDLLAQRGWISDRSIEKLGARCAVNSPLGLCLKSQGALQADQLTALFKLQLRQGVYKLFQVPDGRFCLETSTALNYSLMTGLSIRAGEAALNGLRWVQDWAMLEAKLPAPTSTLRSVGKPNLKLEALEWQVWEFADSSHTIEAIAAQLNTSLAKLQQAAFRLMAVGLVDEIPTAMAEPVLNTIEPLPAVTPAARTAEPNSGSPAPSNAFLSSLVGFLKGGRG